MTSHRRTEPALRKWGETLPSYVVEKAPSPAGRRITGVISGWYPGCARDWIGGVRAAQAQSRDAARGHPSDLARRPLFQPAGGVNTPFREVVARPMVRMYVN